MSDNFNDMSSDSEALSRAERIRAIRAAIHDENQAEAPENPEAPPHAGSLGNVPRKPVRLVRRAENSVPQNQYPSRQQEIPHYSEQADVRTDIPAHENAAAPPVRNGQPPVKRKKKKKKTLGRRFRELFPERGDSVGEVLRKTIFLISIAAIIVCGYMVGDYYLDLWINRKNNDIYADMYHTYAPIYTTVDEEEPQKPEEKTYTLLDAAKKLLDLNSEIAGFITIPTVGGEPIVDLPVVQTVDNSKYLNLNFKGEETRAGALFLDSRNHFDSVKNGKLIDKNSDNLVIYGHNMADDSMFGCLKYYHRNENYYDNHAVIYLSSNYEQYAYKIFAFFIVDANDESETKYDCWNILNFNDEEEYYKFVNEAKRRTIRNTDVDVKYGDPLLTLSTCNTLLGDNGRLIIMARRVRAGENISEWKPKSEPNPNIKWPSLYYAIRTNEKYDPNAPFVPYGGTTATTAAAPENKNTETTAAAVTSEENN